MYKTDPILQFVPVQMQWIMFDPFKQ